MKVSPGTSQRALAAESYIRYKALKESFIDRDHKKQIFTTQLRIPVNLGRYIESAVSYRRTGGGVLVEPKK